MNESETSLPYIDYTRIQEVSVFSANAETTKRVSLGFNIVFIHASKLEIFYTI